jgi:hypothetical protein
MGMPTNNIEDRTMLLFNVKWSVNETFPVGVRGRIYFDNGYGASIVLHNMSYGHEDGLFELGILKDNKLNYDTRITSNVLGHLSLAQVEKTLQEIKLLK